MYIPALFRHGRLTSFALMTGILLNAPLARADADSLATFGVGATFGMARNTASTDQTQQGFSGEFSLRARFLHIFGVEFAYGPNDGIVDLRTGASYDTRMKLSGLLHFIPTRPVGLYLKAGIGGSSFSEIGRIGKSSTSYHAGTGVLITLGEHVEFGAEYILMIPGYNYWNTDPKAVAASINDRGATGADAFKPKFQDVVGVVAQRATASIRYFF